MLQISIKNLKMLLFISKGASIGDNTHIGAGSIIYPNVVIESNTFIGPYCILGQPTALFYNDPEKHEFK